MKRKDVEDVIGGKDAWENVDRADGEFVIISVIFGGKRAEYSLRTLGSCGRTALLLDRHLYLCYLHATPR